MSRKCRCCGTELNKKIKERQSAFEKRIFCNYKCMGKFKSNKIESICTECNKQFFSIPSAGRKFCSKECYIKNISFQEKRFCKYCNNLMKVYKYNRYKKFFCSRLCCDLYKIGKTYEEIYGYEKAKMMKKNQSLIRKGKWHPHTEETKKILRNYRLNQKDPRLGKHHSQDTIEKLKIKRANRIYPLKDSSIELKIQNFLKVLKIEFYTHYYVRGIDKGYQCDIFIPSTKTIIECDGDYWHGNPKFYSEEILNERQKKQKENDEIRNKELEKKGYRVIRLWEHDIKKMEIGELTLILKNEK